MTGGTAFYLGIGLLIEYLGDWLYWRHIKRKLNSCGCRNRPAFRNDYKAKQLSDCGGTTVGGI